MLLILLAPSYLLGEASHQVAKGQNKVDLSKTNNVDCYNAEEFIT